MLQFFVFAGNETFEDFLEYPNGMVVRSKTTVYKLPLPQEDPSFYVELQAQNTLDARWAILSPSYGRASLDSLWEANQDSLSYFMRKLEENFPYYESLNSESLFQERTRQVAACAEELKGLYAELKTFAPYFASAKELVAADKKIVGRIVYSVKKRVSRMNASLFRVSSFGIYNIDRLYKMGEIQEVPLVFQDKGFKPVNIFHITGKKGRVCIGYKYSEGAAQTLKFGKDVNNLVVALDINQRMKIISPEVMRRYNDLGNGFAKTHLQDAGEITSRADLKKELSGYMKRYF
jgi:hypothetical protein